ncbi:MAG: hypothetical protein U5N86_08260 [Planctomycetota bacterium]|nr:hypothetical protein [Planctomycetota bacterium]
MKPTDVRFSQVSFIPSEPGLYDFTVIAYNSRKSSFPRKVRIEVESPLPAPLANAGPDLSAVSGKPFTLNGSLSRQPGGASLTYRWELASAPFAMVFEPLEQKSTQLTLTRIGVYKFVLTVNNGYLTASDELLVRVHPPNSPPNILLSAPGKVSEGDTVVLDASSTTDEDGDRLSFRFRQLEGPQMLSNTITSDEPYLLLEHVQLGTYSFEVTVEDGLSGCFTAMASFECVRGEDQLDRGVDILRIEKETGLSGLISEVSAKG